MQHEAFEELNKKVNELVESLGSGDKSLPIYREFITHKYIVLATYAHMEGAKIDSRINNNKEKLKQTKLRNAYKNIEETLSTKAHKLSESEMCERILKCQELVARNAHKSIT